MDQNSRNVVANIFGKIQKEEDIRTEILFNAPFGDITVPDIHFGAHLRLCVARVPDEDFYTGRYWADDGPKPSDDDSDVFVVPAVIRPYCECMNGIWTRITHGKFVTTESGVVVLDVVSLSAWEGYECPIKRDFMFDRRRLEKSSAALRVVASAK